MNCHVYHGIGKAIDFGGIATKYCLAKRIRGEINRLYTFNCRMCCSKLDI